MNETSSTRVDVRALGIRRALISAAIAMLVFAISQPLFGFYLPSFHLEDCAWNATDVVVVTEGEAIDGKVRVLETWIGEREVGETLSVSGLASFAPPAWREVWDWNRKATGQSVSGRRIVLFLERTKDGWTGAGGEGKYGGIGIASAWIEAGRAYVRSQLEPSGPQRFHESGTEATLRTRTLEIRAAKDELALATKIEDPRERLAALVQIVRGEIRTAIPLAIAEIEKLDPDTASKALKKLLADSDLRSVASLYVAQALIRVVIHDAGPVIVSALERETERWQVPPDASGKTPNKGDADDRADKCQYLIEVLLKAKYPECLPAVARFRRTLETSRELRPYRSTIGYSCDRLEEFYGAAAARGETR